MSDTSEINDIDAKTSDPIAENAANTAPADSTESPETTDAALAVAEHRTGFFPAPPLSRRCGDNVSNYLSDRINNRSRRYGRCLS